MLLYLSQKVLLNLSYKPLNTFKSFFSGTPCILKHSQDIGDHPQGPHVSSVADRLEVDNLRSHKLWRSEQDLELFHWLEFSRQTEIDDLDSVSTFGHTQNVFRLKKELSYDYTLAEIGRTCVKSVVA